MVAPTFKKATGTAVDTANPPVKYGAPNIRFAFDVLDGTHVTDTAHKVELVGDECKILENTSPDCGVHGDRICYDIFDDRCEVEGKPVDVTDMH